MRVDYFFYTTLFLFLAFIFKNSLFWIYLWQRKEYSFVRVLVHLRETNQGRGISWGRIRILKVGLFIFYFLTIFNFSFYSVFPYFIFLVYLFLFLKLIKGFFRNDFFFPKFTPKVLFILTCTFSVQFFLLTFPLFDKYFWLLFLDFLAPYIIGFFILVLKIPTDFYRDEKINKAISKIEKRRNIIKIGITGSYGKNSTRDFLDEILSYKYNVFCSKDGQNSANGIANVIDKELSPRKQVFIAEMEAYKKGEISEMCRMVKPCIGIITGVSDNHISLFKNLTNIVDAQYELIESLPKNGIALFNGNSKHALALFEKTRREKILYGTREGLGREADIVSGIVKEKKFSISFEVFYKGKNLGFFEAKLLGKRNVERLLPAIFIGIHSGITIKNLKEIVSKIKPILRVMEPFVSVNGTLLINDTHYSNSSLVLGTLGYLKRFKKKKIMVLEPFVELGKFAPSDHFELGKLIGETCDYLFLTNDNSFRALIKGISSSKKKCKVKVASPGEIAEFIEKNCGKDDVVVFEGNEANASFSLLSADPVF